ncbi:MAG TPA: hypothetical protein VGF68_00745, partial [Solirubrobacteraceae bacterium]
MLDGELPASAELLLAELVSVAGAAGVDESVALEESVAAGVASAPEPESPAGAAAEDEELGVD